MAARRHFPEEYSYAPRVLENGRTIETARKQQEKAQAGDSAPPTAW
jgi:hypothetical protein